jgi:hypothetical protein
VTSISAIPLAPHAGTFACDATGLQRTVTLTRCAVLVEAGIYAPLRSQPLLIDAVLDATGLRPLFAAMKSTEQVSRGKPAPDVYLAVAKRLGVCPGRCVAIPHPRYPPDRPLPGPPRVFSTLADLDPTALLAFDEQDRY